MTGWYITKDALFFGKAPKNWYPFTHPDVNVYVDRNQAESVAKYWGGRAVDEAEAHRIDLRQRWITEEECPKTLPSVQVPVIVEQPRPSIVRRRTWQVGKFLLRFTEGEATCEIGTEKLTRSELESLASAVSEVIGAMHP